MIRLVIADDHAIVRGGLKRIFALVPDFEVVAEAIHGAEVLERLRGIPCDLLLLDLNMPGISGAELIKRVKAHHPDLPVLVLSMHNEPLWAKRALQAGGHRVYHQGLGAGDPGRGDPQGGRPPSLHRPADG
jgi:DNA-binding NarL/FixJ family response regulator